MIDFSCCEVGKAFASLYSQNEVLSVNPIIRATNQPFVSDGKTVYYGSFHNPSNGIDLKYRDLAVNENGVDVLFTKVANPIYNAFSGYEVRLKNALTSLDDRILKVVYNFDNLAAQFYPYVDNYVNGQSIDDGDTIASNLIDSGFELSSNAAEVNVAVIGTNPAPTINVTPLDIEGAYNAATGVYELQIWLFSAVS